MGLGFGYCVCVVRIIYCRRDQTEEEEEVEALAEEMYSTETSFAGYYWCAGALEIANGGITPCMILTMVWYKGGDADMASIVVSPHWMLYGLDAIDIFFSLSLFSKWLSFHCLDRFALLSYERNHRNRIVSPMFRRIVSCYIDDLTINERVSGYWLRNDTLLSAR